MAIAMMISFVPVIDVAATGTGGSTSDVEGITFNYAYDVQRNPEYPKKGDPITASGLLKPIRTGREDRIDSSGSWTLKKIGTYSIIKNSNKDSNYLKNIVSEIARNYTDATENNIVIHELKKGTEHIAYGVTLAYDSDNGLAVFLGDPLYGGAGYLLSTEGKSNSGSVNISANLDVTDWTAPATYAITVVPTDNGITETSISETIAGDVVTIHTRPNAGYAVGSVSVKDSDNGDCTCLLYTSPSPRDRG